MIVGKENLKMNEIFHMPLPSMNSLQGISLVAGCTVKLKAAGIHIE